MLASGTIAVLLGLLLPRARATATWIGDPAVVPSSFEQALAGLASVLLCGCLAWWWLTITFAVVEAATTVRVGPCPRFLRRAVLLACGLGLVSGLAPASAEPSAGQPPAPDDPISLVGLRLPDRPTASTRATAQVRTTAARDLPATYTVRPGDTLWDIAAARLPHTTDNVEVDAHWRRIWADNRSTIGRDPDLIHPGTVLHLSSRRHHTEEK